MHITKETQNIRFIVNIQLVVDWHFHIFPLRVVAPKRVKLEEAQKALQEKRASLATAQAKLLELNLCLDCLQKGYEEKLQQKEEMKKKVGNVS